MTEEVTTTNTTAPDEKLNKIATALRTLIENAYVYGGPRKNLRRIVEVEATTTQLKIKYEDGTTQYIDPKLNRRFVILLYTKKPSQPFL
jgi:anti-sigma regulatory factor (Ser/Thr protein kinase)